MGFLLPRVAEVPKLSFAMMRPLAMITAALLATACGSDTPEVLAGPNIVVLSIDSLRHDHLGSYGYAPPTSPVMDRLAAEGARFETALSTTSWTLPSHAALFTGLFDSAHGLVDNGLRLGEDHRTLAETLRESGYRTAGFYGGPYLHPTFGLGQGFDTYQSCMTTIEDAASDQDVRRFSRAPIGASHRDVTGPRTLEEVKRWLAEPGEGSFFLFVHFWDVHYDYIPPKEYAELFTDPAYQGEVDGQDFAKIVRERRALEPEERDHVIALYDAEIRFTDDVIGRMLEHLPDDTLVVITADHGEEFFEHGGWGHQGSLFDEQVRVPLIIWWPGHIAPRIIPDQVRLIDLMPTLLTIAGVRQQPATQGRSLVPLLLGEEMEPAPALLELLVDRQQARALREQHKKYIDLGGKRDKGAFDLRNDPGEQRVQKKSADLRSGIARLREEVRRAQDFRKTRVGAATQEIEISEDMARALRELGYTE
jgi:arylsulfatase A-like enzyme